MTPLAAIFVGAIFVSSAAFAQTAPPATFATEFPPGAQVLEPATATRLVAERPLTFQATGGPLLRLQYRSDGFAFVNSPGGNDSGKWRVEGTQLCVEWSRFPSSCNELRLAGDKLYVKRSVGGEVVQFLPQ
jgi:hypothetical protein